MNLSDYTFDELVALKNEIEDRLYHYTDGFLYLCKVRSYGRNWIQRPHNLYSLMELCARYDGEDGIVDVYTTNPDLNFYNYGDIYFIRSEEDYKKWTEWSWLDREIPEMEKQLEEWENRDSIPFKERPYFSPLYSREEIDKFKEKLANFDMSFSAPVKLIYKEEDEG